MSDLTDRLMDLLEGRCQCGQPSASSPDAWPDCETCSARRPPSKVDAGNPYAGTPLWAKYYSISKGWTVTRGVLNAVDGPVHCDGCGSSTTEDLGQWLMDSKTWEIYERPLTLSSAYCFGCGAVVCSRCEVPWTEPGRPHMQADHFPRIQAP